MIAIFFKFQITSDKLDEWKDALPKAGPKFRLGKYFDTIYEIPEFDAIKDPEEGYLSCWDAETELQSDDEFNNFLFAKVDGDSASVVCVDEDEALELIQRWKAKETKHEVKIGGLQTSATKPGSDGTYEVVDGDEIPPEEHIYESIEDCVPEYQIFMGNENCSPQNTPTHITVTQRQKSQKNSSPVLKPKRSNSLPISSDCSPKFARKYSDCSEYTRLHRRQSSAAAEKRLCPAIPPPLPPPNNSNGLSNTLESSTSTEYSQLFRLNGKISPPHEIGKKQRSSIILKHKGKSYLLPITDNKGKNKDKVKRQSSCQPTPKHVPSSPSTNTLQAPPSTDSQLTLHRYPVPRSVSMGFQGPSKNQSIPPPPSGVETTPRRKSKHNSSHSSYHSANSSQSIKSHVTLYGVL